MGAAFHSKNLTALRRHCCGLDDELHPAGIMEEAGWILSGFPGVNLAQQLGAISMVRPQTKSQLLEAAGVSSQAVMAFSKTFRRCIRTVDRGRNSEREQIQVLHYRPPLALSHRNYFQGALRLRQCGERGPQNQLVAIMEKTAVVKQLLADQPQRAIAVPAGSGDDGKTAGGVSAYDGRLVPA